MAEAALGQGSTAGSWKAKPGTNVKFTFACPVVAPVRNRAVREHLNAPSTSHEIAHTHKRFAAELDRHRVMFSFKGDRHRPRVRLCAVVGVLEASLPHLLQLLVDNVG